MSPMKPTPNGHNFFEVLSALQKCIRRGMEREAMYFALELSETYWGALWNRLEVIVNEDIGLANPQAIILVHTIREQADNFFRSKNSAWVLCLANAILAMCRSPKSREADHFQCTVNKARELEGLKITVPDFAYDKHTSKGKSLGRGLEHFREIGTKLVPEPEQDQYEAEAFRLWALEAERKPGTGVEIEGNDEPTLFSGKG